MNPNPPFFGTKVSQPGVNVTQATNNQLIYSNDYSSTIYYDGNGNPSVLLGLRAANGNNGLANNERGLYVAQDGVDVTQATDAQLNFNSNQDVLKVAVYGSYTFPSVGTLSPNTGTSLTTFIPHKLGLIPNFQCSTELSMANYGNVWASDGASIVYAPWGAGGGGTFNSLPYGCKIISPVGGGYLAYYFAGVVDSNNLYLAMEADNTNGSNSYATAAQTVNYIIFQNSITS